MFNTRRRDRVSWWFAIILASVSLSAAGAQAKYGGGSGTMEDPYQIWTAEQLNTIGIDPNDLFMNFKLMADIDLAAYQDGSFHLIGYYDASYRMVCSFWGVFDGNGHTISNLTYLIEEPDPRDPTPDALRAYGLFRYLGGKVQNLGLINPTIRPAAACTYWVGQVGALAGYFRRGSITNCYVQGGEIAGDSALGGLIGYNEGVISQCHSSARVTYMAERTVRPWPTPEVPLASAFGGLVGSNCGEIRDSYATGAVQGSWIAGGLVGDHRDGMNADSPPAVIRNCFATGSVVGSTEVGGLVGSVAENGKIVASYAAGQVWGDSAAGGLVGFMFRGGSVLDCYATGGVSSHQGVGGLVGEVTEMISRITNCYAVGLVTGEASVGGLVGKGPSPNGQCVFSSFWDTETTGQTRSARGGQGKTTAEMQNLQTYMAAGWDFADESHDGTPAVWNAGSGRPMYPQLAWQEIVAGDFVDPEGVDFRDVAALTGNWLQRAPFPYMGGDLTFDDRVDLRDFAVLAQSWQQGARQTICAITLDTNPGWAADGQWQFGPPGGLGGQERGHPDPVSGSTGSNVYGVNLRGDYTVTVDGPHYLTTGPFDCRSYREVRLQFARWLNTDEADYVSATVEVSSDGTHWATVWAYRNTEAELAQNAWSTVTYDISGVAGNQSYVYIRWGYEIKQSDAWAFSGWNIDDIILTGR